MKYLKNLDWLIPVAVMNGLPTGGHSIAGSSIEVVPLLSLLLFFITLQEVKIVWVRN
jgi:hypothetical protein